MTNQYDKKDQMGQGKSSTQRPEDKKPSHGSSTEKRSSSPASTSGKDSQKSKW